MPAGTDPRKKKEQWQKLPPPVRADPDKKKGMAQMVQMALAMVQVDRKQAPWHPAASTICCCRCGKWLYEKHKGMVSCRVKPKGAVVLWHTDVANGCRKALIL